jgi:hypothetical protein
MTAAGVEQQYATADDRAVAMTSPVQDVVHVVSGCLQALHRVKGQDSSSAVLQ